MRILAYPDAGSGSMLLQAIAGGLAGLAVFAKCRWHSIRQWMRRDSKPETEQYATRLRDEIDELRTELHELAEAG